MEQKRLLTELKYLSMTEDDFLRAINTPDLTPLERQVVSELLNERYTEEELEKKCQEVFGDNSYHQEEEVLTEVNVAPSIRIFSVN